MDPDDAEFQLQGYNHFTNLNQSHRRGVILYARVNLNVTMVRIPGDELFQESLWAEIELKDKDRLLVGVIYRSPSCSLENHQHLRTLVQNANEQGASHLLIMGDFNYGDINWKSGTTPSELTNPATAFRETLRDMYLYQHVNEPTHYVQSTATPKYPGSYHYK